jgi:hypothetical protein
MRRMPWILYVWPGLPQLWMTGSWAALALATVAAASLNFALLSSLAWSELVAPGLRIAVWVATGAVWIGSTLFSVRHSRPGPLTDPAADAYGEALDYYLKGDWFLAERIVVRLLRSDPRDFDARLMLATLLRHTGRFDEAVEQLDVLGRAEGCGKWDMEIGRERELLEEACQADKQVERTEIADQLDDRPQQTRNAA